jgi:hypothetical protein
MAKKFGIDEQPSARRPVAWYSPPVLLQAGRELVSSMDFQRNLDRRERFTGPVFVTDLSNAASATEPFWFDFISDSGDSGNATYAVARAALAPTLSTTDASGKTLQLPSGQLLVLGGDLAYPGASPEEYQYRFLELYEYAKAQAQIDTSKKTVVAIPQNHDWFDSLSTFCRYFVNRTGDFIGANTPQKQTYFAVKLPHNWWILGFDWALSGDIDRNQFEAFRALLGMRPGMVAPSDETKAPPQIGAGAQVILVYPEPYWYRELGDGAPIGYPKRYQRLEYLLEENGARIAMRLAGDQHHYARDSMPSSAQNTASHLVTCGSGGAFLHPTHCRDASGIKTLDRYPDTGAISPELKNRIRVGRAGSANATDKCFDHAQVRYPTPCTTRLLALRNSYSMLKTNFSRPFPKIISLDFLEQLWDSNLGFAICLGLLYGFNAYVNSLVFSNSFIPDDFGPMTQFGFCDGAWQWLRAMVFSPTALIINLVMLGGCLRIAWEGPVRWWEKLISGVLHGLLHAFCVFVLYWLATYIVAAYDLPSLCASIAIWAFITFTGILVGGLLFGCYFAVASALFGQMPNNAFSSLAIQSYKGFLRFELTEKNLHAHFIGLDCVNPNTHWDSPADRWTVKDQFDV